MNQSRPNAQMFGKLVFVAVAMFAFGYALVPMYKMICEMTGVNILALGEQAVPGERATLASNTQVDLSRTVTVEFDANTAGPWHFKPEHRSVEVHRMSAQAFPSYAPQQASAHFNKLECFCFSQYTLGPGEKKSWPVVFVIDSKLSKDVKTITLSYTFFEVGGQTPPAPVATNALPKVGT